MTSRKDTSKDGGSTERHIVGSTLGRKTTAVKRQQKKDAITAAMERSQRGRSMEIAQRGSPALGRTVEAAQRGRKKQTVTRAMERTQQQIDVDPHSKKRSSEALARKVAEGERLHKKDAVTKALKESQRRSAPIES